MLVLSGSVLFSVTQRHSSFEVTRTSSVEYMFMMATIIISNEKTIIAFGLALIYISLKLAIDAGYLYVII